jgi:hypothetical protein
VTANPEHGFVIGKPRQHENTLLGTLTVTALSLLPVGLVVGQRGYALAEPVDNSPLPAHQSTGQALAWLPEVYSLVESGNPEAAADLVFDNIDELLSAGDFPRTNELLQMVDVKRLDTNLMISFLAITLAAKSKLPSRAPLLRRVEARLIQFEPDRVEGLLATLR